MVLAPDIPAARGALLLTPPERLAVATEDAAWDIGIGFRKAMFRSRFARRRIVKGVRAQRGRLLNLSATELIEVAGVAGAKLRTQALSIHGLIGVMVVVDEALFRAKGFRFHDSQLEAGLLLSTGHIVEMATGEGKTLTAALPIAVHALAGCNTHVVTVNDYLAERDAEEAREVLDLLGIEVACVTHESEPGAKRASYGAAVTYCANKELVFDFLRERAKMDRASPLAYRLQLAGVGDAFSGQGPLIERLDFVLIDEADSVLVDEANIPLILTEPVEDALSPEFIDQAVDVVETAPKSVWEKADSLGYRALRPEALIDMIAQIKNPAQEWGSLAISEEMLSKARIARDKFRRDVHYIVEEEKIVLIDPQTGRPTPDRTLPWGVQQVIEHREDLEISSNRAVIAKQSFQNYFRKYHKLAGMSGTIREVRSELKRIYLTPVARVRTNRPVIRKRLVRKLFLSSEDKINWAIGRSNAMATEGRAVLIGVSSVLLSEQIGQALHRIGRDHDLLNARHLDVEADIIALAGRAGRVTVVTNMAGRGTDIKLAPDVKKAGGLHVIILDTLETSRLERQLFGRAGRQGDPGSYDLAQSLDEEELKRLIGKTGLKVVSALHRVLPKLVIPFHYALVAQRRRRLERIQRNRRLKLRKTEEKRNENLIFTRAD